MSVLINVGPDRHGTVPQAAADVLCQVGSFLADPGKSIYQTGAGRGIRSTAIGYTWRDTTFYVHLLPGQPGGAFTTPSVGDARVRRGYDVRGKQSLPYTVGSDRRATISGIDRTVHPTDGDTATRWCAADGDVGHWLQVDLGRATALTGARIAWEFPGKTYQYRIDGSLDDVTWSLLADRTGNADTSQVHTLTFTGTARFVKLTVTGLDDGCWASIRACQVFDRPFS